MIFLQSAFFWRTSFKQAKIHRCGWASYEDWNSSCPASRYGMFKPREGLGFEKMTGTFCLETRRVLLPTKCEGIKILTISNRFFF